VVASPVSPFLLACKARQSAHTPVWFMRQAGRALPEYRAIREKWSMEEVIRTPDLAVEVTLQPVRRYGVDAAILFSDIVTPLIAIGVPIHLREGVGPVIETPFRNERDLDRLRPLEAEQDMPYVLDTICTLVDELSVPLIGFAGGPFTLASYLIEGGPSKSYTKTKALMYREPRMFADLLSRLADIVLATLRAQVEAGAEAVQLFDSWIGQLGPDDYATHVLPHARAVLEGLGDLNVPRIHFGVGTGELLHLMADAGSDVVGIDWRTPLDRARRIVGKGAAVQGNLDPAVCLAPWHIVAERVRDVLQRGGGAGHVFNLGHGVLPPTPPDTLARIVELVHDETIYREATEGA
jgi:uroporphyrinogen decarboxylase